jgi:phytanoyl-CoA hydroxylase
MERGERKMLSAKQLDEFEQNGFLKGDVVLTEVEVKRLREELDLVLDGKSKKKPVSSTNLLDGAEYGMSMSKSETVVQVVNI